MLLQQCGAQRTMVVGYREMAPSGGCRSPKIRRTHRDAFVTVMQAAKVRNLDDPSDTRDLSCIWPLRGSAPFSRRPGSPDARIARFALEGLLTLEANLEGEHREM